MRKEDGFARFTRVRALLGARAINDEPMQGRRKTSTILSLMVWNLLVWISATQLSPGLAVHAQSAANAPSDQSAQIEKGRQAVGEACATCHTNILRMVQIYKKSPDQWKDTVYSMIGRGAQVRPDEIEAATAFLAATSGRSLAANADVRRGAGGAEVDGRAILQRTCQQCHDLATASTKLASEDWSAVIAKMTTYGAKLTPADQQKLIEYLNGMAK